MIREEVHAILQGLDDMGVMEALVRSSPCVPLARGHLRECNACAARREELLEKSLAALPPEERQRVLDLGNRLAERLRLGA